MSPTSPNNTPSFVTAYFIAESNRLQLVQFSDPLGRDIQTINPRGLELSLLETEAHLKSGTVKVDLKNTSSLPPPLIAYTGRLGCVTAAYVPVMQEGQLRGLVLIGARFGQELDDEVIQSFERTIRLTTNALTLASSPAQLSRNDRRAGEIKALNVLASAAATVNDLNSFYQSIHEQIRSVIGNYGFVIALYDQKTNSIGIPYLYEDGIYSTIDTFPLGEGLTSILIRSLQPLMLVEIQRKELSPWGPRSQANRQNPGSAFPCWRAVWPLAR